MFKLIILQMLLCSINLINTSQQINQTESVDSLRIINGIDVPLGKYPFVVSIMKSNPSGQYKHFCTGSILNNKTILTAAHCLLKGNANNFRIVVGHVNFQDIPTSYMFEVQTIKHNMAFSLNNLNTGNDIGVMILKTAIDFGKLKNVGVVCLASITAVPETEKCVAIGFGVSEQSHGDVSKSLKSVILPIQADNVCHSKFPINVVSIRCAGTLNGASTCYGDSGGPLACPLKADPNTFLQFGITSFGGVPCNSSYSYFTNVGTYIHWLKDSV